MLEVSKNFLEDLGWFYNFLYSRRNDRVTIQERERMQEENEMSEDKLKKIQDERKRHSTRVNLKQLSCVLIEKRFIFNFS